MTDAVVVLAAGSGTRVGADRNKVLLPLGSEPLIARSVRTATQVPGVGVVVVVAREDELTALAEALSSLATTTEVEIRLVAGGATRHASESAGLRALSDAAPEVIAIHDGARPLADVALYTAVIDAAREQGGAVPGVALPALVSRSGGPLPGVLGAARTVGMQTPQAFRATVLHAAYDWAAGDDFEGTDTAACVAAWAAATGASAPIRVVTSSATNVKVTFAADVPAVGRLAALRDG